MGLCLLSRIFTYWPLNCLSLSMILWFFLSTVFGYLFWKLCDYQASNPLKLWRNAFPSLKLGQKLYQETLRLSFLGRSSSKELKLVQYKFFTGLLDQLVIANRKYGARLYTFLPKVKKALIQDLAFEKKLRNILWGGVYQMMIISLLTWTFWYSSLQTIEKLSFSNEQILSIALQCLGLCIYLTVFCFLRLKTFSVWEDYIKKSYLFLDSLSSPNSC